MPVIVYVESYNNMVVPITVYRSMIDAQEELTRIIGPPTSVQYTCCRWDSPCDGPGSSDKMAQLFSYGNQSGDVGAIVAKDINWGQLKVFAFDLD